MQRWIRLLIEGNWLRGSNRQRLAGVAEALVAASFLLGGFVFLSISITLAIIHAQNGNVSIIDLHFILRVIIATFLILIGLGWIIRLLWHVGVSAERREAISAQADELEILRELRHRREDLPTVPRDRLVPQPGRTLPFRIVPLSRNVWGLVTAALLSTITVSLSSILVLICAKPWLTESALGSQFNELSEKIAEAKLATLPQQPWLAGGLLLVFIPAAGWSIFHFFRQLIKLAGVGPTSVELSKYPLTPGNSYKLFLSQTGRVRLQLFEVELICEEQVTYNQGTDIRTETAVVFSNRLMRQRGVSLTAGKAFETELEFELPALAMHSFNSTNNRVQWKIIVTAKAKKWPNLTRTFRILVFPNSRDTKKNPAPAVNAN